MNEIYFQGKLLCQYQFASLLIIGHLLNKRIGSKRNVLSLIGDSLLKGFLGFFFKANGKSSVIFKSGGNNKGKCTCAASNAYMRRSRTLQAEKQGFLDVYSSFEIICRGTFSPSFNQ